MFHINFNYFVEMSGLYEIKLDPFYYKCEDKCGGIFSRFLDKHLDIYGVNNVCIRVFSGCEYKLCNEGNSKEIFNRELHKYTSEQIYIINIPEQARYFILNFKLSENKIVQSCASFSPVIWNEWSWLISEWIFPKSILTTSWLWMFLRISFRFTNTSVFILNQR